MHRSRPSTNPTAIDLWPGRKATQGMGLHLLEPRLNVLHRRAMLPELQNPIPEQQGVLDFRI